MLVVRVTVLVWVVRKRTVIRWVVVVLAVVRIEVVVAAAIGVVGLLVIRHNLTALVLAVIPVAAAVPVTPHRMY
jgi:hypothetical protein